MKGLKKITLIVLAWVFVAGLAITKIGWADQRSPTTLPTLKEYRLSLTTQAPLTIRPNEFKAMPAQTNWKAEQLFKSGKPAKIFEIKGATGDTTNPNL